jgi:rubrerythrin
MNKLKQIIEYAMRMEDDAREFYTYNQDRVKSPAIKKQFGHLAEMEKNHYAMLNIVYDSLNTNPPPITISWVVDDEAKEINPPILADNYELISDEAGLSDLSVVRMAYLMESDFAVFYKSAAETLEDGDAKKALLELAGWEEQHREMFRIQYEKMLKDRWGDIINIVF